LLRRLNSSIASSLISRKSGQAELEWQPISFGDVSCLGFCRVCGLTDYLPVFRCSSIVLSLFSISESLSRISFRIRSVSSARGPRYCPGGLRGDGSGSIGVGLNGSTGLRGSNLCSLPSELHRLLAFSLGDERWFGRGCLGNGSTASVLSTLHIN
jgi:hypothetical protein